MKSKVVEAKKMQGYRVEPRKCGTCLYFAEFRVKNRNNRRCGKGLFAVKKNSVCNEHEFLEKESE